MRTLGILFCVLGLLLAPGCREVPSQKGGLETASQQELPLPVREASGSPEKPSKEATPAAQPSPTVASNQPRVSPVLNGQSPLKVTAVWEHPEGPGWQQLLDSPSRGKELQDLRVSEETRTYKPANLQGLLPKSDLAVGETWPVPQDVTAQLLSQFHSQVIVDMNMDGAGSYAVLRGVSDKYLDVMLRLHAQFEIADQVYYTPAAFQGHLVVDRKSGDIAYLKLAVPTEHARNLGYEMHVEESLVGLDFIPAMELTGGDAAVLNSTWSEELDEKTAEQKLASNFYNFTKIDWVPPDQAVSKAQAANKPIFAVVIEGVLDDQSC